MVLNDEHEFLIAHLRQFQATMQGALNHVRDLTQFRRRDSIQPHLREIQTLLGGALQRSNDAIERLIDERG